MNPDKCFQHWPRQVNWMVRHPTEQTIESDMLDVCSVHDTWLILIKDIWWLKWDLGRGKTCSNSHILWSYYSRHLIIPTHSSKTSSVKRFFPTLLFDMEWESSFKGRGKRSSFPLSKPVAKNQSSIRKGSVHHRITPTMSHQQTPWSGRELKENVNI